MKIKVMRCDGRIETLTLIGTVSAGEPAEEHGRMVGQGSLHIQETGTTHYFRAEDGAYDGWAMDLTGKSLSSEEVMEVIAAVDRDREIQEP